MSRANVKLLRVAKAGKPPKRSYLFELANAQPMALAGLWDARGGWLQSFAIVTTETNELMSLIHSRTEPSISLATSYAEMRGGGEQTPCGFKCVDHAM